MNEHLLNIIIFTTELVQAILRGIDSVNGYCYALCMQIPFHRHGYV